MRIHKSLEMKCLFCFSTQFVLPDNYQPQSGDMVKCANCGRMNDYDSMMKVLEEEASEIAKKEAEDLLKDFGKKIDIKI